jgi:hypothetical protein
LLEIEKYRIGINNTMIKKYYVYKIQFPDSTYYIGYRGTCKDVSEDFLVKYFSSSKVVAEKIKNSTFSGEILHKDLEKEIAYNIEQELISKHFNDTLCLNKACYYGRDGFGMLSSGAKEKISKDVVNRWKDPVYKSRLVEAHKERWESNPELKERQSLRLTGQKRPEHSAKLKGHPGHTKCKGVKKHPGHGALVSAASKGKPKSTQHRLNLSGPKPRICRLTDKKEISVNHFTRWINSLIT